MRAGLHFTIVLFALAAPFVSCHSDSSPSYPAFPFDLPTVVDSGGPKMTSPNLVVLVDPNDPNAAQIAAALEYLQSGDYWSTTTSEYGIGPIASAKIVAPPKPFPATITEVDVMNIAASYARDTRFGGEPKDAGPPEEGGIAEGGASDASASDAGERDAGEHDAGPGKPTTTTYHSDTLYVVVLPPTTKVTDVPCNTGGEHDGVYATATDMVAAAFVRSECPPPPDGEKGLTETEALAHEIIEAVTDPFASTAPAFLNVDPAHAVLSALGAAELADQCVGLYGPAQPYPMSASAYLYYPRIWSNRLAALGQDPCVPTVSPYAMALPVFSDQVTVADGVTVNGVNLALDQTVTIPVRIANDAPGQIAIGAVDAVYARGGTSIEIEASLDRNVVQNGDVVNLTLTRRRYPFSFPGFLASAVVIVAQTYLGSTYNYFAVGVPPK
jgi:hypothetical protein